MRLPRKSPGSWQHQLCPSPEEIRDYKYGHLDPTRRATVGRHIRRCRVCAEIFRAPYPMHQDEPNLPERPDLKAVIEKLYRNTSRPPARKPDPLHLATGQVWTVTPPPPDTMLITGERVYMGTPVVIVDPGSKQRDAKNLIGCMPLSSDTAFHRPEESIVVQKEDSPLGYAVLVEVFNERPMLASALRRCLGTFNPEIMLKLNKVREQLWSVDQAPVPAASTEHREWKRLEIEMAAYLSAPVNEALWAEEDDQEKVVWLQPVRLAAETEGLELKEIHPTLLWRDERLTAGIVQTRDRVRLKVVWGQGAMGRVTVDGRSLTACEGDIEEQYFDLGTVGMVSGALNIEIEIAGDVIRIRADFKDKPAEE